MMIVHCDSLHTTEIIKTLDELKADCDRAEAAEIKAVEQLRYDPNSTALHKNIMKAAEAYDKAFTAWIDAMQI